MTTHDDGTDPTLARALRRMGTAVVPVEEAAALQDRRAQLIGGLTGLAEQEFAGRERRRRRTVGLSIAAAALLTCGAFLLTGPTKGTGPAGASVLSGEGAVRVEGAGDAVDTVGRVPLALKDRDRVETLEGRAKVRLSSGATVDLGARTRLDLLASTRVGGALDEQIALPAGQIHVQVPKLGAGSRLTIRTPNASVTVHGTAFVVDVHPAESGGAAVTTVSVTEGLVSVESAGREVFLERGAKWSSGAVRAGTAASAEETAVARVTTAVEPPPAPPSRSTLSDENQLFKAALAARHDGHPAEAIALIGKLLSRFPSSPLAAEAKAERERARADLRGPAPP